METAQMTGCRVLTKSVAAYGRPDRAYFFSYGANMNPAQLLSRCSGKPVLKAVAQLTDHRLAFHGRSGTWDGGLEAFEPAPGCSLWGVIHELVFSDAYKLDAWQDARLDGSGSYFHCPVRVFDTHGGAHDVIIYRKDQLGPAVLPSREQLDFIAQGAEACGLPEEYVARLRRMESKDARYPVPRTPLFDRGLLATSTCDDCDSAA